MGFMIEKEKTGSTPQVLIDEDKGYMLLRGESFHEDVIAFYRDTNQWLADYLETDFGKFIFDCELSYFNSSTAKLLLNILLELDDHSIDGNEVVVNWITTKDNVMIIEFGEDFEYELENLEFNLVVKEEE